jgi:hypothetical protein
MDKNTLKSNLTPYAQYADVRKKMPVGRYIRGRE